MRSTRSQPGIPAVLLASLLAALLTLGCGRITELVQKVQDVKQITPSDVVITETREVSGFSVLDIRSFGRVILTQGEGESLTISGSDNLVPLVTAQVSDGVLVIDMAEKVIAVHIEDKPVLTFEITLPDLSALTVAGLAEVEMDALTTQQLAITISGAGNVQIDSLSADRLDITVSGLGNVEIAGRVAEQQIEISGAGEVNNAELECETAIVNVPGLGNATVWVTEHLSGRLSGAGGVRYYGQPTTDVETSGPGKFEALGAK